MKLAIIKLHQDLNADDKERLRAAWQENKHDPVFRESFSHHESVESITEVQFNRNKHTLVLDSNQSSMMYNFGMLLLKGFNINPNVFAILNRLKNIKNGDCLFFLKGCSITIEDKKP